MIFNAASLAYLMERCQRLKVFALQQVLLDVDHFRVVDALSRPGLEIEIELSNCRIIGATAAVLAQVLRRN
jgi:hypothetical protein